MTPMLPAFTGTPQPNRVYNLDLLALCDAMPVGSVDMILCDLPYGTTECAWDVIIPFVPMWKAFKRIAKPNSAIVLTCSGMFTHELAASNKAMYRYDIVWDKVNRYTGYGNANIAPLRRHEMILVFYENLPVFNKQHRAGLPYHAKRTGGYGEHMRHVDSRPDTINNGLHNPCSIIAIESDNKLEMGLHPTQKPVDLFKYLIRTYTEVGQVVFDPCVGSGTTAIAAREEGRSFIVGDSSLEYVEIARARLAAPYTPSFMPQLDLTA